MICKKVAELWWTMRSRMDENVFLTAKWKVGSGPELLAASWPCCCCEFQLLKNLEKSLKKSLPKIHWGIKTRSSVGHLNKAKWMGSYFECLIGILIQFQGVFGPFEKVAARIHWWFFSRTHWALTIRCFNQNDSIRSYSDRCCSTGRTRLLNTIKSLDNDWSPDFEVPKLMPNAWDINMFMKKCFKVTLKLDVSKF